LKDQTDHTVTPPLDEGLKERLRASFQAAIAQALKHLPTQRPMDFFVLQNTLYSFEHLPFTEGVEAAAALFKAEPWLSEEAYRRRGRRSRSGSRRCPAQRVRPSGMRGSRMRRSRACGPTLKRPPAAA
jgi:hypothetical protein